MKTLTWLLIAVGVFISLIASAQEADHGCSCVEYVRQLSRYQPPRVYSAKDIPAIRFEPKEGGWVLFKPGKLYSEWGHAAYVEKIWTVPSGLKVIEIKEFNFYHCKKSVRTIPVTDDAIRGYFWHNLY